MLNKFQHIKRKKASEVFAAVASGEKAFEVAIDSDELSLDYGDVITFMECDSSGKITGKEIIRKVVYKERAQDVRELLGTYTEDELLRHGVAILGLSSISHKTLKSIYDLGVTMHLALDTDGDGFNWSVVEGPHYGPTLVAPDLMAAGIMEGLNVGKWPAGRYSVTMLVQLSDLREGKPVDLNITDMLVLVITRDRTTNQQYGGLFFEEIDPVALLDGKAISIEGKAVAPLTPKEVTDIIKDHELDVESMLVDDLGTVLTSDSADDSMLNDVTSKEEQR